MTDRPRYAPLAAGDVWVPDDAVARAEKARRAQGRAPVLMVADSSLGRELAAREEKADLVRELVVGAGALAVAVAGPPLADGRGSIGERAGDLAAVEGDSVGGRADSVGGRPDRPGSGRTVGGRPGSPPKPKRVKSRTVDKPVSTSDPVGISEIAERCGVTREKVVYWRTTGLLPDPDWLLSSTPIWGWESLQHTKVVAVQLGTHTWGVDVPPSPSLRSLGLIETKGWVVTARRVDRHGYGWLTVPVSSTQRLFITDDPGEAGELVSWAEANGLVSDAMDAYTRLRKDAPRRVGEPMTSSNWKKGG